MSGVRRAVLHNSEAVIIFHSPRACCQVIDSNTNTDIRAYFAVTETAAPVLTSNLTDKEAIFGGEQALRNCLRYAVEKYAPKYMVVVNSCTSGVIGDDIESICSEEEGLLGVKIFPFTCSGLMNGAFDTGIFEASTKLLEYYAKPQKLEKGLITLIGMMDTNKNNEYAYLTRLLGELGVRINCSYPGYASVEAMQKLRASEAILLCSRYNMMGGSYKRIAEHIRDTYNLKLLDLQDPIGYGPTMYWLEQLAEALELPLEIVERVKQQEGARLKAAMWKYKAAFKGTKGLVYIYKRPSFLFSAEWYMEMLAESGIEVKEIAFDSQYSGMDKQEFINSFGFSKYVKLAERTEQDFSQYDFVFAIWGNVNRSDRIVKLPYLSPMFGAVEIEKHFEMLRRKLVKRSHED